MLEVCGCQCILAAGPTAALLREALARATLVASAAARLARHASAVDADPPAAFTAADLHGLPATRIAARNRDTDLAHILFTSGSTGVPKGVMVTHQSVLRFLQWAWPHFGISASDRASQHSPLHFDLSTFDIFSTLGAGAQLHLTPPGANLLPHKLAQFIRKSRLTQWFSVPSVLNLMAKLNVVRSADFPALRRVMWCGEVLPTPHSDALDAMPAARELHQSLRPHGGNHSQQSLHRAAPSGARARADSHRLRLRGRGADDPR